MADNHLSHLTEAKEQPGIDIKKYLFKALSFWYLFVIRLVVPIGLLHCAAHVANRAEGATRLIRPHLMGFGVVLLVDLPGLKGRRFPIAGVLQHQRLGAVADHDPHAVVDFRIHKNISKTNDRPFGLRPL